MGAEFCTKRFCKRTEAKPTTIKKASAKLESNFNTHPSNKFSDHKIKYIRRFNFDFDPNFNSNSSNFDMSSYTKPKNTKIPELLKTKRIRHFDFSTLTKPNYQKEGYDLMVKIYGEKSAKEFSNFVNFSQQSINHLKELLESLQKIPRIVNGWNQVGPKLDRLSQIKKLNIPKTIGLDEPELDEKVVSNLIKQLNELDTNEPRDGSYIYPYGDEPIDDEDANLAIRSWFKQLSNRSLSSIEKQMHIVCYIAKITMSTWKNLPWTKLIYGYYMARDLYRIFTGLNIVHLDILELIQSILGITFDWNEFNQEAMKLDEDIDYIYLINTATKRIELDDPTIFNFIEKEANLVAEKIDNWIMKIGQI